MSAISGAIVSAIAAGISALCAVLTYRLTRKTLAESEAEERLYAGQPTHPDLREHEHSQAVIYVVVNAVRAFDGDGTEIEVTWSDRIDDLGNPVFPSYLVAVLDLCHIYARRNDGEWFSSGTIKIFHSFKNSPLVLIVDPWKA